MPRQKPPPDHPAGFKFYPNDWLSSPKVSVMSPAEEGAYIRLLAYCWADKQFSLPDDDAILARLSRLGELQWKVSSSIVRACFISHPTIPGRIVNLRLLKERRKQQAWIKKCHDAGVKSGEQRRIKHELTLNDSSTTLEAPRSSALSLSLSLPLERKEEEKEAPRLTTEQIRQHWNTIQGVKPCKKLGGALLDRTKRMIGEYPLEWWTQFFTEIAASPFLTGKISGKEGKRPFRADLEWATGPTNLGKILSGKYADDVMMAKKKALHVAL